MNRLLVILFCGFLISGCHWAENEQKKEEKQKKDQTEFNLLHPELVSTNTPKGKLWRAKIERFGPNHWIYWFDNSSNTISLNIDEKIHHTVVIDGQEYFLKPK